jgi:hypothetical protein
LGAGPTAAQSLSLVLQAVNLGERGTAIGARTPWLEQVEGKNRQDRHDATDETGNEGGDRVWSYHRDHRSGKSSFRLSEKFTQADFGEVLLGA